MKSSPGSIRFASILRIAAALAAMLGTLAWSAGIFAVCLWPIMTGYRRASTSR